ncbi:MAG: hypothetical protein ABUR63_00845, partial [Verrucomicrobiota bacterium]
VNCATFADVVGMVVYLITCSLIIAVGQAMRTAKARVNQQSETLRVTLASIGDAVNHDRYAGADHVPQQRRDVADRLGSGKERS